jgi:hypothetical protein
MSFRALPRGSIHLMYRCYGQLMGAASWKGHSR